MGSSAPVTHFFERDSLSWPISRQVEVFTSFHQSCQKGLEGATGVGEILKAPCCSHIVLLAGEEQRSHCSSEQGGWSGCLEMEGESAPCQGPQGS